MFFRRLFCRIVCADLTDQADKDLWRAKANEMSEWTAFQCVFCPWLIRLQQKWSEKKLEWTLRKLMKKDPEKLRELVNTIEETLDEQKDLEEENTAPRPKPDR